MEGLEGPLLQLLLTEGKRMPSGEFVEIMGGGGGSTEGRSDDVVDCGRTLPVRVRVGEGSSPP